MSYLVLARKYRPQRFSELVGQEHVARTLANAIAQNRVHHAFLFTGARGVGKTSAARILAKALSCEKGPTADPCGVCDLCQEIAAGRSVDVIEIDAASNTKVEETKSILEGVRYAPARARRKVYIIDEVHMLSAHSFNALLKTLEEPPSHVVFVFATTEVHKIPVTILSRCQRFDFKLISTARLAEHLDGILRTEKIKASPDAVRLIARQAAGSVRDALSLLDQAIAYVAPETLTAEVTAEVLGVADRRLLVELAGAALDRDAGAALRLVARAADRGVDFGELGRSFLGFLRDLEVIARVSGGQGGQGGQGGKGAVDVADLIDATAEEIEEARAIAGRAAPGLFPVMFDRWARAVDEASRLPTPRLLFEMAALDLCAAEPMIPLGDLLQRLDELEGRLRGAPRAPGTPAPPAPPAPAGSGGRPKAPSGQRSWAAPAAATAPVVATAPAAAAKEGDDRVGGGELRSPEPVAGGSGNPSGVPGSIGETWRRVMTAFEAKGPRLASLLAHAEVVSLTATELTLAFEGKRDAELADKARGEIEQGVSTTLGRAMKVAITVGAPAAAALRSEVGSETDAANVDRQNREAEARQHPVIRRAQDVFGAALKEIKTP
ncbi:MAG TPA: DNA polymerase III subunit gamma/tau [Polyangia bacterium]|jgi:DNA polymerase-3 subunit gamma/tau